MAAAAVAACQNKAAVEEPAQGSYVFTLKASAPDAETKTDYSSNGKFSWSEGDAISVLFHKGDDNKFFTLTATKINGASADFSGTIDEGYEIGGTTGLKWALYPAGNHKDRSAESYEPEKYPLYFDMPAVTDYSESGFSANMPMYALGDDSDCFSFEHLCAGYKFTFTDIDDAISKVKFEVETKTTYPLSGYMYVRNKGGIYMDPAGSSGAALKRTFIANVTNNSAVFYVPVRYYADSFKPVIKLYNANNDDLIYSKEAASAKAISSKGHIQPINISVSGAVVVPWNYESAFDVDWTDSNVVSGTGQPGFNKISMAADATYLYMLAEIQKDALEFNVGNYRENAVNFYINEESVAYGYLAKQGQPQSNDNSSYVVGSNVLEHKDVMYYEWKIDRAAAAAKDAKLAPLGSTGPVELRLCVFPKVGVNEDWSALPTTDWNVYMYAPASGAMTVSLP